jgi:hypothetical protein
MEQNPEIYKETRRGGRQEGTRRRRVEKITTDEHGWGRETRITRIFTNKQMRMGQNPGIYKEPRRGGRQEGRGFHAKARGTRRPEQTGNTSEIKQKGTKALN